MTFKKETIQMQPQAKQNDVIFKEEDFPPVFIIDTVSICNLRCSMCVHKDMTRRKDFMPWDLFTKIIDEIAENRKDARVWMILYGDPFIRSKQTPSIFDMIRYAKDKELTQLLMNTNACLMDEDNIRKIIASGIDEMYVGIDAFSEKTHSENRVGGDYNKVVENVNNLLKIKKEMNDNLKVFVQFVELDNNIHERDDFINYWLRQGANVKIRQMITWRGEIERKAIKEVDPKDRIPCYWANMITITDKGEVPSCANDLNCKISYGNIAEQSIKEIWNNQMRELRANHINCNFDKLPETCQNCLDWHNAGKDLRYFASDYKETANRQ